MLKSERHNEIARRVQLLGPVSVAELAEGLQVSQVTVRRDLDELSKARRLRRVRGGASPLTPRQPEPPVVRRQVVQVEEKRAIGLIAAELIQDGDIIAVDSGSTILELAKVISRRAWENLQVVTNSFLIVDELMRIPGVRLVFVGGTVYPDEMGTYGTLAADMLKHISVDKLFIGCRGIDWEKGLTTDISDDAQANITTVRAFAETAHQVIVLADHTKFGQVFLIQIMPLSDVDIVVTDNLTSKNMLSKLRKRGTRVIQASPDGLGTAEVMDDSD